MRKTLAVEENHVTLSGSFVYQRGIIRWVEFVQLMVDE